MADTRRLAALKAVETVIAAPTKPAELEVTRFAFRGFDRDSLPRAVISHGGGLAVNEDVNVLRECQDLVNISVYAQGNQTTEPDDLVDPYLSWIISQLQADITLGGEVSALTLRPTGPTEVAEEDFVYIRVVQPVEIQYYHNRTNPESAT